MGGAFEGCTSLKKISLPESLVKINERAFCNCKSLVELKLPNSLDFFSFSICTGCDSLKSLILPKWISEEFYCLFEFGGTLDLDTLKHDRNVVGILICSKNISAEQLSSHVSNRDRDVYKYSYELYKVSGREGREVFIDSLKDNLGTESSNISELYAKAILGE